MNKHLLLPLIFLLSGCQDKHSNFLEKADFSYYIERFNAQDTLNLHLDVVPETSMISNEESLDFLKKNIPYFECPDKEIEEIYYYRWWTFRKHIKQTPHGYIITEFMPFVPWAKKYNTIPCPAGHHVREGRWLHNENIIKDYLIFWLKKGGDPYSYSFWISDSFLQYHMVHPNDSLLTGVLPDLIVNFSEWEKRRRDTDGLFWQVDGEDGMEVAIGGSGKRPTINTYMFADSRAISVIAQMKGDKVLADNYADEAERIRELTMGKLWDKQHNFFKVLPSGSDSLSSARELLGYVPWYLEIVPKNMGYEKAWEQLMDPGGFYAPFGPTTAEQRHPLFRISYEGHECQWNGPSWPFATAQTLTALANVLNDYPQDVIDKNDFFEILKIYTKSQRFRQIPPEGTGETIISDQPWIDENLNPFTGDWLARTRMQVQNYNAGFKERGIYYNHSTYNDIIITALAGLRPSLENKLTINPLIPDSWDWFCLDYIPYKNRLITILWDRTGRKYNKGKGLRIYVNGELKANSRKIMPLSLNLDDKGVR